ncbi:MAG: ATP-dependent DNA ligase [Verrucomicrobia bacterium]|nr:MAG: ATP-dependent DNA ligase [Verrucomicrobiota bacterium]
MSIRRSTNSLGKYRVKRDFSRTREPAGRKPGPRLRKGHSFVVQKHAARRLHYDFRLEMAGVLKSWAVPKGFPTARGDRHLAIEVEDHPLEYRDFEGTIPEGNYGAGTVMVWDKGTYDVSGGDSLRALEQGKLHLTLEGKKLKGEWTLVRMRRSDEDDKTQWMLIKSGNDMPPLSARAESHSAATGRTMEQIASAKKKSEWQSNRTSGRAVASPARTIPGRASARTKTRGQDARAPRASLPRSAPSPTPLKLSLPRLPKAKPGFIEPMKALLREDLPQGPQWIYEIKFDGVRTLATKTKGRVSLTSRAAKDFTDKYSPIAFALRNLPAKDAVLDGEIVAVDAKGRSSFQLLQSYLAAGAEKPPLFYYVFDLLVLDGQDFKGLPLWQRKAAAQALIANLSPIVRFSASLAGNPSRLVQEMKGRGLEGMVAKLKDSKYEPGRRSGAWVKFKWTSEQEFVIGGYTKPQGARSHFGAILVGYYQDGQLLYAAKVGTGFDQKLLASLYQKFQTLRRPDCPFANLPEQRIGSSGAGMTASRMKSCTWLDPKLVCQVRFAEWTRDNHLRIPSFLGLREDKKPKEVVKERPV